MLEAPLVNAICRSKLQTTITRRASSAILLRPKHISPRTSQSKGREELSRVRAQAFFDRVFKRQDRHAPELVRLDAEDEGGLGQTSAELFGPLASAKHWLLWVDHCRARLALAFTINYAPIASL